MKQAHLHIIKTTHTKVLLTKTLAFKNTSTQI